MGKTGGGTGSNQYKVRGCQQGRTKRGSPLDDTNQNAVLAISSMVSNEKESGGSSLVGIMGNMPHVLETLARDPDANIRAQTARNPNLPFSLLDMLSRDGSYIVRQGVASNPAANAEMLTRLFKDKDTHDAAARNPNLPAHLRTIENI